VAELRDRDNVSPLRDLETDAHILAARVPALLVEARRVSHTVTHGIHGRRRAGPGETFWQFRHFENSDAAASIDWRRSASSDHLFVREREWEAAHTAWMWIDMSPSMQFQSHLARISKAERAIVLALATGELLVRGGERIGLLGGRPRTGRAAVPKLAESILRRLGEDKHSESIPPKAALNRFSDCLLFSDFLEPLDELCPRLEQLAVQGVRGHLVQILDPAEETLPYQGRTEFLSSEGGATMTAGRAETLRERYQQRLRAHREALTQEMKRLEWSLLVHHTDRPAEEILLALHARMAGMEHDYRYRPSEDRSVEANEDGAGGQAA
jgi:uncharacterized protein (DUF58 family)